MDIPNYFKTLLLRGSESNWRTWGLWDLERTNTLPTILGVRTVLNRLPELHKLVLHLKASNTMCGIEPLSQLYVRRYIQYPLPGESSTGFEPVWMVLQTTSSPLGQPDLFIFFICSRAVNVHVFVNNKFLWTEVSKRFELLLQRP